MTIRKEQKTKEQPPEQPDDLALDPETAKDLEPQGKGEAVRGGIIAVAPAAGAASGFGGLGPPDTLPGNVPGRR